MALSAGRQVISCIPELAAPLAAHGSGLCQHFSQFLAGKPRCESRVLDHRTKHTPSLHPPTHMCLIPKLMPPSLHSLCAHTKSGVVVIPPLLPCTAGFATEVAMKDSHGLPPSPDTLSRTPSHHIEYVFLCQLLPLPALPCPEACRSASGVGDQRCDHAPCLSCLFHCRYDDHAHKRFPPGTEGRPFAYFVNTGGRFFYASAARLVLLKGMISLSVSQSAGLQQG